MYTVDEWHDFYVMVGGAAAVLTGLIFVAISIHLRQVIATPLFRARARYLTAGPKATWPFPVRASPALTTVT
jgi:hypothetical protein